ncbi:hypothetical protein [uncultured Marinobacter sp.]|uniref:hypothetical protein n=1 Tax=uncultured Marinobacter sp. TaxID=187379 RepID=UPI002607FA75|nr:hypothetical protein [uncultured Marinobacter sp.]
MKDSPLSCDFPETNLEGLLETRVFHTRGARLASPPAKPVVGVSDSSEDMELAVAYICERFIDIRTAFSLFRRGMLVVVNLFMVIVLLLMWFIDNFYSEALMATAAFLVPVWVAFYLFEIFFPLTLPVRIDRDGKCVYVVRRGTCYQIPWEDLEVAFSYNWQYFGSGVMWDKQYYAHVYLWDKYYFCGRHPKRQLERKKIFSCYKEEDLYRRWNFVLRFFNRGKLPEDLINLEVANYDSYLDGMQGKSVIAKLFGHLVFIFLMPTVIWWKFSPFKYKWPKEVESIFGKINYH